MNQVECPKCLKSYSTRGLHKHMEFCNGLQSKTNALTKPKTQPSMTAYLWQLILNLLQSFATGVFVLATEILQTILMSVFGVFTYITKSSFLVLFWVFSSAFGLRLIRFGHSQEDEGFIAWNSDFMKSIFYGSLEDVATIAEDTVEAYSTLNKATEFPELKRLYKGSLESLGLL